MDDSHCNLKEEDEDGMESFSERKANTNPLPPALKGNKNAMSAGNKVKAFSQRILNGSLKLDPTDINGIANQMLFEINLVAGKMLIMQHQLIEVLKISPRHIVENLAVDYRDKISERWSSGILRSVVPTHDFA